jgi:enoyl-CoA hydratase/carnithine racemase
MSDLVLRHEADGIVTLTLNRPEQRNPISDGPTIEALVEEVTRADRELAVRVVIVTGAGKAFSTGGDISAMGKAGGINDPLPANTRRNYRNGIQRLPLLFEAIEIPVIAAVNGPAIGAGCDLACMCDIRIAGESAKFGESFVKLGIVPGDGGAWLLPRVVGFSKACEMAFTGDVLNAAQALACNLVSQVVPDRELPEAARALALRIAANPPHAVRMTKRLIRDGRAVSLASHLETSAAAQALCHATADHHEAVAAFLEKRAPIFTGK